MGVEPCEDHWGDSSQCKDGNDRSDEHIGYARDCWNSVVAGTEVDKPIVLGVQIASRPTHLSLVSNLLPPGFQ